ncbi:hypothetical protein B7P43_G13075, partial [Cryptotermes secundus]
HDNARPHAARQTVAQLQQFGWNIITHPPYSPDLAPSDYHLFPKLKEHLSGKRFNNDDEVKAEVRSFLNSMEVNWYDMGIQKLPLQNGVLYEQLLERLEERYCIKFCQKLGDTQAETIRKIQQAFGYDPMGVTKIKEWTEDTAKGCRFDSREDIVQNATAQLHAIPKEAFQNCFQRWKDRWAECVESQGAYFEGD